MGNIPRRAAIKIVGLVLERVRLPVSAVVGSFDDDLRTTGGHHRKQTVWVHQSQRRNPFQRRSENPRRRLPVELHHQVGDTQKEYRASQGVKRDAAAATRFRARHDEARTHQARRQQTGQGLIVKQKETQAHGEEIEETVISGQADVHLQQQDGCRSQHARPAREKDEERYDQLDDQRRQGAGLMDPMRQLMRVPCERRRQRLRFEMVVQRRQRGPSRIAAQQLHAPREKHETKQ